MHAVLQFEMLGPLRVRRGAVTLDLGRPKQRALLGRLLLAAPRAVSADRLVDDVWGERPPARAMASLQAYVSNLRRILEPGRVARAASGRLVREAPGYRLVVQDGEADVHLFERAVRAACAHAAGGDPRAAHRAASVALTLWKGPLLADLQDHDFVTADRARIAELHTILREVHLAAALDLGEAGSLTSDLGALVAEHPLRERPWELLLTALDRAGRTAEALDRFRAARTIFHDAGLEPSDRLRRLELTLLGGDRRRSHPIDRDTVGRRRELAAADAGLARAGGGGTCWLVVAGGPGTGKSHLLATWTPWARAAGARVVHVACPGQGLAPPFWVVSQLLLRGLDGGRCHTLDPVGLLGLPRRPGVGSCPPTEVTDAFVERVTAAASEMPLVVAIDDVQWADRRSLAVLTALAGRGGLGGVFVILLVRQRGLPAPVTALLGTLDARVDACRLELSDLTVDDIVALARQRGQRLDPIAAAHLQARTGGNACLVSELLRSPSAVTAAVRRTSANRVEV